MKKLENIRIASPCHADWNEMTGDDQVRTCAACAKQVFNLSEMTRAEAEATIARRNGDLCARYYQRKDGTIILADCTIGGGGGEPAASCSRPRSLPARRTRSSIADRRRPKRRRSTRRIDEVPIEETITSSSHDAPPPPRDLKREARERALEAVRKRLKENQEHYYIIGGVAAFNIEEK